MPLAHRLPQQRRCMFPPPQTDTTLFSLAQGASLTTLSIAPGNSPRLVLSAASSRYGLYMAFRCYCCAGCGATGRIRARSRQRLSSGPCAYSCSSSVSSLKTGPFMNLCLLPAIGDSQCCWSRRPTSPGLSRPILSLIPSKPSSWPGA